MKRNKRAIRQFRTGYRAIVSQMKVAKNKKWGVGNSVLAHCERDMSNFTGKFHHWMNKLWWSNGGGTKNGRRKVRNFLGA